ncbi:MAG: glycoside hydrolase family 172 protein, partial [Chitinophagaceae bacterium]
MNYKSYLWLLLISLSLSANAQELYQQPAGIQSRVSSFENINGVKSNGGKSNKGAKGNAFEWMQPGEAKTLIDVQTTGIIQRIWLTVSQDKNLSRDLRLQMWWDHDN